MTIPLRYSMRNLRTRSLTTALTAGGMALVVFVFAAVLMLDAGLRAALVATGQYDNIVVTRRAAGTEIQSIVDREQAAIVTSQSEIAVGGSGARLVSREVVVLIALPQRNTGVATNVGIRGLEPPGLALRPQVHVTAGRMFHPGAAEVVVGKSIAERFGDARMGGTLRFGSRTWTVVGTFDAGGSAFDSEIWADSDQLMQSFRRRAYSSIVARLADPEAYEALTTRLAGDPRLTLDVKRERVFYEEQSQTLSSFIRYLGITLSIIFSIGAMVGAMITMYTSVANRTAEIGTLRALGFGRASVLAAFLFEAVLIALVGCAAGLLLASGMQLVHVSTLNWDSFSEISFRFTLTPGIVLQALFFALAMGVIGGLLPALRAARLNIVDALRSG
ncbi:MAG TPA: FtsX-like permease family protein [Burkholderiales bacterium]